MKMNVDFSTHIYEIEFTPFLGERGDAYREEFDRWYYEEVEYQEDDGTVTHCLQQRFDLDYEHLDIEVVLDWFKIASPDCDVKIISHHLGDDGCDKTLPTICF